MGLDLSFIWQYFVNQEDSDSRSLVQFIPSKIHFLKFRTALKKKIYINVYTHIVYSVGPWYTLRKKVRLRTLFVPYLEPSGKRVPKMVLYMFKNLKRFCIIITKNGSKGPKKVLKNGSKDPFRTI